MWGVVVVLTGGLLFFVEGICVVVGRIYVFVGRR